MDASKRIGSSGYFENITRKVTNNTLESVSAVTKYDAVVVENKKMSDGGWIKCYISSLLPLAKGLLKDNPIALSRTFKDMTGREHTAKGTTNIAIIARYWSQDSFRKTAPDVQAGERVKVWQTGDSDAWWWEPTNLDDITKRRGETVVQAINAGKQRGPDQNYYDSTNTYYQEMSSHNKTFTIHTSNANGEVSQYDIQINAKDGAVIIKDDEGNFIELNTVSQQIWLQNSCQTKVLLNKNNIDVQCNENYTEMVGKNKSIKISGNADVTVSGNINITVNGNADVKVSGNTNVTCPTTAVNGNVTISGTLDVGGTFTAPGMSAASGGCTISTPTTVTKPLEVQGPVKLNGGTSSSPIEGGYIDT